MLTSKTAKNRPLSSNLQAKTSNRSFGCSQKSESPKETEGETCDNGSNSSIKSEEQTSRSLMLDIFCLLLTKMGRKSVKTLTKHSIFVSPYSIETSQFFSNSCEKGVGLFTQSECSQNCLVMTIILLDRMQSLNPQGQICRQNLHMLTLTAFLISLKYVEDNTFDNISYSKITGVPLDKLNRMEAIFLGLIDFSVYVSEEYLKLYSNKMRTFSLKLNQNQLSHSV